MKRESINNTGDNKPELKENEARKIKYLHKDFTFDNGKLLSEMHYELWNWVTKHPFDKKEEFFRENELRELEHYCFACEYDSIIAVGKNEEPSCKYCPICAREEFEICLGGLYNEWEDAFGDYEKRTELATQIRDLPWKYRGIEEN